MTRKFTNWTYFLIALNILFLVTPISIYGYYSDTIFLIATLIFISLTIYQRVKSRLNKTITLFFIFCLIVFVFMVYQTFDFHFWGPVKTGTVKSIEQENKKSNFIKRRVYYRVNENDTIGPSECVYWEKGSFKYFPIFEWTLLENYNSCGEIEELK